MSIGIKSNHNFIANLHKKNEIRLYIEHKKTKAVNCSKTQHGVPIANKNVLKPHIEVIYPETRIVPLQNGNTRTIAKNAVTMIKNSPLCYSMKILYF